ncbi:IclR family transcriptional regulator [Mycetocola lacteus]|uniref:IclR family transcriptional regulator n=1 Tax=Mycetocola lacteus TaxID=76637 RepID=A0A3L7ATF7_9MICO|nr:IclR family transcriptional regulator [Mycetocola lacteus]RLP83716.1 IclR family transcriptional regulator [Mycetocola lacteus]
MVGEASRVPAAEQTLQILTLLSTQRGPLPASMIATQLDLPRSSVYHLLNVLVRNGFVLHLAEEKRYGLGVAAAALSSAYARQEPLSRLGRPLLAGLVDRVGASAHLAVLHGRDVLYIVEERARNAPSLVTDVDVRLPAPLTATGRAILAGMPPAQVRALFPDKESFVSRGEGPDEITRYGRLREVLGQVQRRGYATEEGSVSPGLSSVACAVHDHRGWPVAGLAVTFPANSVDPTAIAGLVEQVQNTADTLTQRIYGRTS